MAIYLNKFENHTQYENYINSKDAILPNVSICTNEGDVHYNPYVANVAETRVVAKYNVTDISNPTRIGGDILVHGLNAIEFSCSDIEIDGVAQSNVVSEYTFNTTGEHTVKYTLETPTNIYEGAFSGCDSLTSIYIPDSVTRIGKNAFQKCTSLTSIDIPDSVTSIGNNAFAYTSLTSIIIPNSVTSIDNNAFQWCAELTSIDIPDSVTSIGNNAFAYTGLTSIIIPNSVTSIGDDAFQWCTGLTSIDIPDSVTSIGNNAFAGCSDITSIVSNAMTAPTIYNNTFKDVRTEGTLTVPSGSTGYDTWMQTDVYYLGYYNWSKVEQ